MRQHLLRKRPGQVLLNLDFRQLVPSPPRKCLAKIPLMLVKMPGLRPGLSCGNSPVVTDDELWLVEFLSSDAIMVDMLLFVDRQAIFSFTNTREKAVPMRHDRHLTLTIFVNHNQSKNPAKTDIRKKKPKKKPPFRFDNLGLE